MISAHPSVRVAKHPLIQNALTQLRDYRTPSNEFRRTALQLGRLLIYEAMAGLSTKPIGVETPMGPGKGVALTDYVILAPVLRAGLVLSEAAQDLFPNARIYHIGLRRDEETLKAISYYSKLPEALPAESCVFVLDPMLATGGSAVAAMSLFGDLKVQAIHLVSFLSAPEGIKNVQNHFPSAMITTGAIDDHLNEHGYIIPGLGDAGDRIFGT
jgi:uracil phosphoribosyltransferase